MKRYPTLFLIFISLFIAVPLFAQSNNIWEKARLFRHWGETYDIQVRGQYAYVATSHSGLQIMDISNPAQPQIVGYFDHNPEETVAITLDGDFAYCADKMGGILIIDIADPTDPKLIGVAPTDGRAYGVAVSGNYAFAGCGTKGVQAFDITDKSQPVAKGTFGVNDPTGDIEINGKYAYFTNNRKGLRIIDISNPNGMFEIGSFDSPGTARAFCLRDTIAYIADGRQGGLQIVNVKNPIQPVLLGTFATPDEAINVWVDGNYAYISDEWAGVVIVDVTDPANPVGKGTFDTPGVTQAVCAVGNNAFVADWRNGMCVLDVTDKNAPAQIGGFSTPGWWARNSAISGNTVYLANSDGGIRVIDVTTPEQPDSVTSIQTVGPASDLIVHGDLLFVAEGEEGISIFNITNPHNPQKLSQTATWAGAANLFVRDTVAFVACGAMGGLMIFNVADPANPTIAGSFDTNGDCNDVVVDSIFAYIADVSEGVLILDISDLANPAEVYVYESEGKPWEIAFSKHNNAVVFTELGTGIRAMRVANPRAPLRGAEYPLTGSSYGITINGKTAFIGGGAGGIYAIDITSATTFKTLGWLNTPGYCYSPSVSGQYLFAGDGTNFGVYKYDRAPIWSKKPTAVISKNYGDTITFTVQAYDPESAPIAYTMLGAGLPVEAQFTTNDTAGFFNWITAKKDVGEYTVKFVAFDGEFGDTISVLIKIINPANVEQDDLLPHQFGITAIYPNPFNNRTMVTLNMPSAGMVKFALYDLSGRKVANLSGSTSFGAGLPNLNINAESLPAGTYLLRVESNEVVEVRKLMLVK